MYRLEYSKRFSTDKHETYYLYNHLGKVCYESCLLPHIVVNHDLKEIIFYQIYDEEENYEINNTIFNLTEDTLMNIYEDYEVNLIRTQCNMIYHAWKQNGRKF